jgi:hypothetical protein
MAKRQTFIQRSRAVSPQVKARIHEVEGAGRRKVRREFFGLNGDDERALWARLDQDIDRELDRNR